MTAEAPSPLAPNPIIPPDAMNAPAHAAAQTLPHEAGQMFEAPVVGKTGNSGQEPEFKPFTPLVPEGMPPETSARPPLSASEKQETERLMAFDKALKNGDERAVSDILDKAEEASFITGSSEYDHLSAKFEAHRSGRPLAAVLRKRAFDRAAEAGDKSAMSNLLDQESKAAEETGDTTDYDRLVNRAILHRRRTEQAEEIREAQERPQRESAALAESLLNSDPESKLDQSRILDAAYDRGQKTGDYREYNALVDQYFRAKPHELAGAQARNQILQEAIRKGDKATVERMMRSARDFGIPHEFRRFQERLPQPEAPNTASPQRREGRNTHRSLGIVVRKMVGLIPARNR